MPDALRPLADGTVEATKARNTVLWVEIDVPPGVRPGVYFGAVDFYTKERRVDTVPLAVNVRPPAPQMEAGLELNFWQSWSAVEDYYDLEPFSQQWWGTVKEYVALLADSGQDVVQVGRRYVTFRRVADGQYQFDFTNFDRYVQLCTRLGITGPIEYLAMMNTKAPTSVFFRDDTGTLMNREAEPGEAVYDEVWAAFLRSLLRHCDKQGWKERLRIFIADRPAQEHIERFIHAATLVREADESIETAATFDEAAVAESLRGSLERMVLPLHPSDAPMEAFIEQSITGGAAVACYFNSAGDAGDPFDATMYDIAVEVKDRGFEGLLLSNFARWPGDLKETSDGYETAENMNAFVYPSKNGPRSSLRLRRLVLGLQASATAQLSEPEIVHPD